MEFRPGTGDALPNPSGVKLTYDDFVRFPDDGLRHEVIDGEHYVTPSPNAKHQKVLLNLTYSIEDFLRGQPIGQVFFAPLDVLFSRFDVVEPDLVYMSNERASTILTTANIQGAPQSSSWKSGRRGRAGAMKRRSIGSTSAPA